MDKKETCFLKLNTSMDDMCYCTANCAKKCARKQLPRNCIATLSDFSEVCADFEQN